MSYRVDENLCFRMNASDGKVLHRRTILGPDTTEKFVP